MVGCGCKSKNSEVALQRTSECTPLRTIQYHAKLHPTSYLYIDWFTQELNCTQTYASASRSELASRRSDINRASSAVGVAQGDSLFVLRMVGSTALWT